METEIEVKFLFEEDGKYFMTKEMSSLYSSVDALVSDVFEKGKVIKQGYLPVKLGANLGRELGLNWDFNLIDEVRLRDKDGEFYFTLKGKGGISRREAETRVTHGFFDEWWYLTEGKRVEKVRMSTPYRKYNLEMDVYTDRDLVIGEIEVPTLGEALTIPLLGKDVTKDLKYKNKNLAR